MLILAKNKQYLGCFFVNFIKHNTAQMLRPEIVLLAWVVSPSNDCSTRNTEDDVFVTFSDQCEELWRDSTDALHWIRQAELIHLKKEENEKAKTES